MTDKYDKKEAEARCWAWASLVIGSLILFGALSSGAWPVILVEIASVVGSALFLFGGEKVRQASVVVLAISAILELVGGGIFLLFAIYLISAPSTLGGFGFLLGIYAFVFSIPVVAVGVIDGYTVSLVRTTVYGNVDEKEALGSEKVVPSVNLAIPVPV